MTSGIDTLVWIDLTAVRDTQEGARTVQIQNSRDRQYPFRYRMAPAFGVGDDWIEGAPIWRRYPEALQLPKDRFSRDEAIRRDIEAARRLG